MVDKGWLSSLFDSRSKHHTGEPRFELVVLEGEQQGEHFPIRYDRMLLGRRTPDPSRPREICLRDRSVSLRQATLEIKRGRVFIEHLPGATNPTIVNRRKIARKKLKANDVIILGLVILELREIVQARRPEARPAVPEPTAPLVPPAESARDIRPQASVDAEARTWLDVETTAPADQKTVVSRPSSEPAAPGPEDETVIGEPNPIVPETAADLDDAPLPEDDAATVVRPPPTPPPEPGPQDETIIVESNDRKPKP